MIRDVNPVSHLVTRHPGADGQHRHHAAGALGDSGGGGLIAVFAPLTALLYQRK